MSRTHNTDFTRDNYRKLLQFAKQHYHFKEYGDRADDNPTIWWRHDVDMSMHAALALAKIEAELGIKTTYFLLPGSAFYQLLEPEILSILHQISGLGHAFGLHFDATKYTIRTIADLEKYLSHEKQFLEIYAGVKPTAFSFHNPNETSLAFSAETYAGLTNTYADYFRKQVAYCSDSNGTWRHERLQDVLQNTRPSRLQVLTHPEWWTDSPLSPRQRVLRAIDGRARKIFSDNNKLLQQFGRPNQDDLEDVFLAWESIPLIDALELQMLCLRDNLALAYLALWKHAARTPAASITPARTIAEALLRGEMVDPAVLIYHLRLLTTALGSKSA